MRSIYAALIVIALGLASLALLGIHQIAAADAPPDAGLVDRDTKPENAATTEPPAAPLTPAQVAHDADQVEKLWRSGAVPSAVILTAWLLLSLAARRWRWLAADHRAVYVSAALGALTMLVDGIQRGLTPNVSMIVTAAIVAFGIAQDPRKPAENAAKASGS